MTVSVIFVAQRYGLPRRLYALLQVPLPDMMGLMALSLP